MLELYSKPNDRLTDKSQVYYDYIDQKRIRVLDSAVGDKVQGIGVAPHPPVIAYGQGQYPSGGYDRPSGRSYNVPTASATPVEEVKAQA